MESSESFFTYIDDETWETFNDLDFIPVFFNQDLSVMFPDDSVRTQAIFICNDEGQVDLNPTERKECYYDFAVLKDADLAKATSNSLNATDYIQAALGNFPPTLINAATVLELIAGQTYTDIVTLTAEDQNGDDVTYSIVPGSLAELSVGDSSGIVSISSVPTSYPFSVTISVSDGTVETLWKPSIKYCVCQVIGS